MSALVALALLASVKPAGYRIDENRSLIWGEEAYHPIGVRISNQPSLIQQALDLGLRDFVLEVSASGDGWAKAIALLESKKARYMLAIQEPVPKAKVVRVEPALYRLVGLSESTTIDYTFPGTQKMHLVVRSQTIGVEPSHQTIATPAGRLTHTIAIEPETGAWNVVTYPVTERSDLSDFWEGMDKRRDQIVRSFRENPVGEGYRGLIDPLGPDTDWGSQDLFDVPVSRAFQYELAAWLSQKYERVIHAGKAWGVSANDFQTMGELAQLVPLWSRGKGHGQFWHPNRDMIFGADIERSQSWNDIQTVVRTSSQRRFGRLVSTLRKVTGAPVIVSWNGWNGAYSGDIELDGIMARAVENWVPEIAEATSSLQRRSFPTTGIMDANWSEGNSLKDWESLGYRSVFFRATAQDLPQVASGVARSQWATATPRRFLFYPEFSDATIQPGVFGAWWALPTPQVGERLVSSASTDGFTTVRNGIRTSVLWADRTGVEARIRSEQNDTITVREPSGRTYSITGGTARVPLGTDPILIEHTGTPLVDGAAAENYIELKNILNNRFGATADPDGTMLYAMNQASQSLSRSPAKSIKMLRDQAEEMSKRVAKFVWLDAQDAVAGSDGVLAPFQGARNGRAWLLDNAFKPRVTASYSFEKKSNLGAQIWVAARVPKAARASTTVTLDGAPIGSLEGALSQYGRGICWTYLGQHKLGDGKHTIEISAPSGHKIQIDALMISDSEFRPDGGRFPFQILTDELKLGPIRRN